MITGVSSGGLSQIFRQQTAEHSKTLMQIATGKRFTRPSEDFANFSRIGQQQAEIRSLQRSNDDLTMARGAVREGTSAMTDIHSELKALQELRTQHSDATAAGNTDLAKRLNEQFEQRRNRLAETFSTNQSTIGSGDYSVNTAVGSSLNWNRDVSFNADDIKGMDITDNAKDNALDAAATGAENYLTRAEAFSSAVDRQSTLNENRIAAKNDVVEQLGAIDEMREMSRATSLMIRQQATVAMAAQANMAQMNMAKLFDFQFRFN